MSQGITAKVQLGDDFRRIRISEGIVYEELGRMIGERYEMDFDTLRLKYKDEDGDLITIASDSDLREAMNFYEYTNSKILRLIAFQKESKPVQTKDEDFERPKKKRKKKKKKSKDKSKPDGTEDLISQALNNPQVQQLLPQLLGAFNSVSSQASSSQGGDVVENLISSAMSNPQVTQLIPHVLGAFNNTGSKTSVQKNPLPDLIGSFLSGMQAPKGAPSAKTVVKEDVIEEKKMPLEEPLSEDDDDDDEDLYGTSEDEEDVDDLVVTEVVDTVMETPKGEEEVAMEIAKEDREEIVMEETKEEEDTMEVDVVDKESEKKDEGDEIVDLSLDTSGDVIVADEETQKESEKKEEEEEEDSSILSKLKAMSISGERAGLLVEKHSKPGRTEEEVIAAIVEEWFSGMT